MNGTLVQTNFASKVSEIKKDFELGVLDRCDRCGAQAYVEVNLEHGKLLFCGHHYGAQKASLLPLPSVLTIRDETGRLHIKPVLDEDD